LAAVWELADTSVASAGLIIWAACLALVTDEGRRAISNYCERKTL